MKIDVKEIEKISVKFGDVLVFTLPEDLSNIMLIMATKTLESIFEPRGVSVLTAREGEIVNIKTISKE